MFDQIISHLNSRNPSHGLHSQLLENESSIKKTSMAKLFLSKTKTCNKATRVPAECIDMSTSHSTFIFKDMSVAVIPNNLIC